ncbi:MAG: TetR/AcrR family transcriptional regulator [Sinimarinibacterium flocculans]|uniref:TetR/AcrR family transcriptional regulator n=1 Tax=Sinimarinibacterium flocculans TaxID=985250 RepID=UPI003C6A4F00
MAYRRSPLMEERLASNRERILAAARRLVAAGGYREAQIAAVAAEAGMSTGMIYRYFRSKAELFIEVLEAAVGHEIELLNAIAEGSGTARQRLYAAVDCFTRRALTGPGLAYAFIAEPAEPEVDTARIRVRQRLGDVFKTILRQGIEAGEFPPQDLDASAACIVGAYTEALVGPIAPRAERVKDRDRLTQAICEFCVRAVSAGGAASAAPTPAPAPARTRRVR